MNSLPKWFAFAGAVLLIVELVVVCRLEDCILPDTIRRHPRLWVLFRWILGVASLYFMYPIGEKYTVLGFPFMAAAFERVAHVESCGTTPFAIFIVAANVIFFQLLPQLIFSSWLFWKRKTRIASSPTTSAPRHH